MQRSPLLVALAAGCVVSFAQAQLQITIDPSVRYQNIDGFGAAAVGVTRQATRDVFENPAFADLLRDDLGVTVMRVEVPYGLQPNPDLDPNTLDWARFDFTPFDTVGHLATNLNAGHPGAVKIIGTLWSPPWWMKTTNSIIGGHLRTDRYPHFAKYCAAACLGFQDRYGVALSVLSPQNEPAFEEPYASCAYSTTEYRDMMHALVEGFDRFSSTATLFGPEDVAHPQRWITYVAAMASDPLVNARVSFTAAHHYPWIGEENWTNPAAWILFWQALQPYNKPFWSTEVAGEEPTWLGTPENGKCAIILANQIHDALVYGNASGYLYWAISDPNPTIYALMAQDQPTKKYYACKQYFRYVRPGAHRIGATVGTEEVMISAYAHDADQTMTIVVVNIGYNPASLHFTINGGTPIQSFQTIRSSETENTAVLAPTPVVNGQINLNVPMYSVVTLVGSSASCYANCDASTQLPVLNVADFVCFQSRFAAGDPYANCDGSTMPPVLNVADFVCFQSRFAAGCP